jgi:hypothetical protein
MQIDSYAMRGIVILLCASLVACTSPSDAVDRRQCERLRDHLVELRLRTTSAELDASQHRRAFTQALGEGFLASCLQLDRAALDCGLRADDLASATACSPRR